MFERCIKIQNDFTPAYLELVKLQPDLMGGKLLQQVVLHNQHDQDYLAQFGNWLLSHSEYPLFLSIFFSPVHHCSFT